MTRTMFDGVNPAVVPAGAQLYAGYIDGRYQSYAGLVAKFPDAVHVPIAVFPTTNAGAVLDVEPGDASPAQAVDWVIMRRKAGATVTVYCNSSTWPAVRAAFHDRGIAEPYYWIAQYDGDPVIPLSWVDLGAVAKQYSGGMTVTHDVSSVLDHWPGVDKESPPMPPAPGPAAPALGFVVMVTASVEPGKQSWLFLDGARVYVIDDATYNAYALLGVPQRLIGQAMFDALHAAAQTTNPR